MLYCLAAYQCAQAPNSVPACSAVFVGLVPSAAQHARHRAYNSHACSSICLDVRFVNAITLKLFTRKSMHAVHHSIYHFNSHHLPILQCRVALSFGWLCFLDLSVLFWPIAHNSFLHTVTGIPYAAPCSSFCSFAKANWRLLSC